MRYSFLLSGENIEIALAEVFSLAECFGKLKEYFIDSRVLTIDFEGDNFFKRLAFSHEAIELLHICDFYELEKFFSEINVNRSICVRISGIGLKSDASLERKLGAILWKKGVKINLVDPDETIRVYITPQNCYIGLLRFKQDKKQFLVRKPNLRPFFMPIVTLPKLSKALVNLTAVREGIVLDPMCGTGSFLIEAGLMGIDFCGIDYYRDIVEGCRRNLDFMGLGGNVLQGDARNLPFKDESFDGVITDYPYFKATRKINCRYLYERSLEEIARVIKKNCRAVIVTNIDIDEFPMEVIYKMKYRVHGSLTRRIYVLKNCRID
ncbi:MAG: methyltransferase domain-containing protein [Archaeoglobaceae archaeon]|nr:methyltransferase domain-containing protein [Archaeoglobaceae archaeon]MDW7989654.1 methyltransferase domain-containing protein [Archaeoglobaceae archaeon]